MIVVQCEFQAVESQVDKFKEMTTEARTLALEEKGCMKYEFSVSLHHQNLFFLYEEWEDGDASKEHATKDHVKNFIKEFEEGGGKFSINIYEAKKIPLAEE
eukprot:TRINITY_DN5213_c0_g1_i3.p1 TRINITY_DN5213_c0_g1~~TRINITY_DN5213_c0_g1_i3.p1  ORF type:complete len:101 (-),score=23.57 TRINITY_DN5213_c0_g1_i3:122-424(-)